MVSTSGGSLGLLVAVGASLVACNLLLDAQGEQQCAVDGDCASRGFPASICVNTVCVAASADAGGRDAPVEGAVDPWGCLGAAPPPKQNTGIVDNVHVRRKFVDWTTRAPHALLGKVCGAVDPTCGPDDQAGDVTVASDGIADVPVPRYFRGFLSLAGTLQSVGDGGTTGRMPLYLPLIPIPVGDDPPGSENLLAQTVPVAAWQEWKSTMDSALNLTSPNTQASLSAGHILVTVFDCTGTPTTGATVTLSQLAISPKTTTFYIDDATLLPSATRSLTGTNGGAGFVNAPAANLTLTAELAELKRTIASYTIPIQPGTLTYVAVWPNGP